MRSRCGPGRSALQSMFYGSPRVRSADILVGQFPFAHAPCGQECPMPLGFQRRHPGGMADNSPAFQRRDRGSGVPSPEGTAENHKFSRPFGTQPSIRPHPALKRWAIVTCPAGTKTRPRSGPYSSNPSDVGQLVTARQPQRPGFAANPSHPSRSIRSVTAQPRHASVIDTPYFNSAGFFDIG